ncbi:MAG: isoprenylcysteine carboxylmethyltransferase family protein [Acidimicrobiia bacterium]|nr:isoprenylcysteine carboxylmethyltransferase family protein [Acidimicrobiia bacterium]
MSFREKGGWWVVAQVVAFLALAVVFAVTPRDEGNIGLVVIGWVLVGAGVWLAGDAVVRIRQHLTPYPAPVAGAPLRKGGAYAVVRHPIYAALVLEVFGFGLAFGSTWTSVGAFLLAAFFGAKLTHEERLLVAEHPDYEEYQKRVPWRLVRGLW